MKNKQMKLLKEFYQDDDGYWGVTIKGYKCKSTDSHTIHDDTMSEFNRSLKTIEKCECERCKTI